MRHVRRVLLVRRFKPFSIFVYNLQEREHILILIPNSEFLFLSKVTCLRLSHAVFDLQRGGMHRFICTAILIDILPI